MGGSSPPAPAPTHAAPGPDGRPPLPVPPIALDLFVLEWRLVLGDASADAELAALQAKRRGLDHFALTHALEALLAHRAGDFGAKEAALDRLSPDRAVGARRFLIDRDPGAVDALLRAHVAQYCEAARAHLPPHIPTPAGPCPTAGEPPSDYAAFEQWAGASHGERRIREWTTDDRAVRRANLVAELGVGPGESVADVGAGEGYFLDAFARAVGPSGRVTSLEVDPALVAHLRWYGDALGHAHAEARQTPLDRVDLEAGSQDVVFICEVMKAVVTNASAATPEGRAAARGWLQSAADGLKPGGRLVIIDHDFGERPHGPSLELLTALAAEVGLPHRADVPGYGGLNHVMVFTRDRPWTPSSTKPPAD